MSKIIIGMRFIFFAKIIRKNVLILSYLASWMRKVWIAIQYPSAKIDKRTFISKNCQIICDDASSLVLTDVFVSAGVTIRAHNGGHISILESYIGPNALIAAAECIEIKKNALIAEMVVIRDSNHNISPGVRIWDSGLVSKQVTIGENVWIGSKASILMGCIIGNNSIIAASAVVVKDVLSNSIYGGIPAKKLSDIPS